MKAMTRRGFVKNAAIISAGSALGGIVLPAANTFAQSCGIFNVVLHGLFVIDIATGYVQISTPECINGQDITHPHSYRAGSWKNCVTNFPRVKGEYKPIWPAAMMTAVIRDVPILSSQMGKPDHSKAYLSLILPTPYAITGLRTFDKQEIDFPADYMTATKFPLVTVLSYDSPPVYSPIPGTPWDTKNYHLFAEPEDKMDCNAADVHGKAVIQRLWKMFQSHPATGPKTKNQNQCLKAIDPRPGVRCVERDEERALSELGVPSPLEAVHMPTCAVFVAP
ncbi:MAG TPA: hypothetical protein VIK39_11585 [Candidatus Angelobacter sp.]